MRAAGTVNCIYSITLQFYQAASGQYSRSLQSFSQRDENVDNVQNAGHQFRRFSWKIGKLDDTARSPRSFTFRK